MENLVPAVLAALAVSLAAFSGAAFASRRVGAWVAPRLPLAVALAAGVLAAVTWHVAEEAAHELGAVLALALAAAGFVAAALAHRLVPEAHCHDEDGDPAHDHGHAHLRSPRSVMIGDALHSSADGLALGSLYALSPAAGAAALAGVFAHELVRQSSQFFIFRAAGYAPSRAVRTSFLLALAAVPGAALGVALAGLADWAAPALAALAAGAFAEILFLDLAPSVARSARRGGVLRHAFALALGVALALAAAALSGEAH
jgi:zinc transporter ZupT